MPSQVAVLRTRPETVVEDYGRLMRLVKYDQILSRDTDLILKLNLSWTKYFPACSSQPWQVDGILKTLVDDGYERRRLLPVENKTVVTNPDEGCRANKWRPVLQRHGVGFTALPDVEWIVYPFRSPLLKLNRIFPEGIQIPKLYPGKNVLHLPTVKCVHPDTEILLSDGRLIGAESLVKEWQVREPVQWLPDGDAVSEGETSVVSLRPDGLRGDHATHFWRTPVTDGLVCAIRTRTGRQVTTSTAHPFLTPEGWKRATDIRVGDRIAVARRIRIQGRSQPLPAVPALGHDSLDLEQLEFEEQPRLTVHAQRSIVRDYLDGETVAEIARRLHVGRKIVLRLLDRCGVTLRGPWVWARVPGETSTDFWRWMGYFVAEGWARENHGSLAINVANNDPEIRSDYMALCKSLFGVLPRENAGTLRFNASNLRSLFAHLGFRPPTNAATKHVPDVLFKCPDEEISGFLSGYFDGDGTVGPDGVHATTKSPRLASQIQMLLARLGVLAFVGVSRCKATNRPWTKTQDYAKISIYGQDVVTFARWVGFRCARKRARLQELVRRRANGRQPSHWDTVPVPPALFRFVREGLKITHRSSERQSAVSNIEWKHTEPTRPVVQYFVDLFERHDTSGRFRDEIAYMRYLAQDDIAWDRVSDKAEKAAEVPYLYDLSVRDSRSFIGNGIVLHNTHGHSVTTGAIKNSFGGLLKEARHYAHEFMHDVLVDLMYMQREIHPAALAVMDGTVMGDGAGPRTMVPREGNLILASADQVAIDAIAARIMGFDPLAIPYLRMCHERGLGVADPRDIEIVGDEDAARVSMGFKTSRSLVIWGDQLIRRGPLRPLKRLLLHSPLVVWAPFASNVYHDLLWYPTVGRARIRAFRATPWGALFEKY
ncbi:MAG: DUF362 domain-containing protein [Candidatus Rokubacteria bacterium]|nr:DUF362 domain-containing protein [Candidatus Rokubacteria bacterium]MBI3827550.1 DUF362 domain-containing protein [Candidatus Rokubacteria bacterium]